MSSKNANFLKSLSTMFTSCSGRVGFVGVLFVPFQVICHASFQMKVAMWTNVDLEVVVEGRLGLLGEFRGLAFANYFALGLRFHVLVGEVAVVRVHVEITFFIKIFLVHKVLIFIVVIGN